MIAGRGLEWARDLVPPAFCEAISDEHVPDLFGASVALAVRLSVGEAPACVAEEVMMVRLMEQAEVVLDMWVGEGHITRADGRDAASALSALFDLAGDDDVMALFEMVEPADAALAGHDPVNRQLRVVDQRLQAWFHPFGGTVSTGYLRDRAEE